MLTSVTRCYGYDHRTKHKTCFQKHNCNNAYTMMSILHNIIILTQVLLLMLLESTLGDNTEELVTDNIKFPALPLIRAVVDVEGEIG